MCSFDHLEGIWEAQFQAQIREKGQQSQLPWSACKHKTNKQTGQCHTELNHRIPMLDSLPQKILSYSGSSLLTTTLQLGCPIHFHFGNTPVSLVDLAHISTTVPEYSRASPMGIHTCHRQAWGFADGHKRT